MKRCSNPARLLVTTAVLALVLLVLAAPASARQADTEGPAVTSVGLADADGTVLYGVLLTGGDATLENATVTGTVPDGARLVEVVQTPKGNDATGAIAVSEEGEVAVSWSVAALPADTILGPFTYRVALADEERASPTAPAELRWDGGTVEAAQQGGELRPLADSGAVTVDADGTDGLVAVGETGVLLHVPPDAVEQSTTLTFTRLPIEDSAELLPERDDLWWCSLWEIAAEPAADFAEPVRLALPNRTALTPGLVAEGFILGLSEAGETTTAGIVTFPGTHVQTHMVDLAEVTDPIVIGQGVGALARDIAATSAGTLDPTTGLTQCEELTANMSAYSRRYWDSVVASNTVAATYYRELYYASKHAFDSLGC